MPTQREIDLVVRLRKLQLWQECVKYLLISIVAMVVARYMFLSVKELAGKTTTATLITETLLFLKAPRATALVLSWLLTGASISFGVRQSRRAKKIIARFHPERRQVQLKVDPNKRSSGITLRGETGPQDL